MNAAIINLVNRTFVEKLYTQEDLARKELAGSKVFDSEKRNKKRLCHKERNNEHLVFNYLLCHFPVVITTKGLNSELIRKEMGDSEFEKVFKKARRFYRFRLVICGIIVAGSSVGFFLSIFFNLGMLAPISFVLLPFSFTYFLICLFNYCMPECGIELSQIIKNEERYL